MFNKKAIVAKDIKISNTVGGNRARLAKQSNNIDFINHKIKKIILFLKYRMSLITNEKMKKPIITLELQLH